MKRYVEYGALATAPGPLVCERARIYCFFVEADHSRVQQLCDRVLSEPTDGRLRYVVPRIAPVILTFGVLGGLRSEYPGHDQRGSAIEPEAAIWIPTLADGGRDGGAHLSVFMPYIWVDDPIAFASGREIYGFAKTQGWMRPLGDPRTPLRGAANDARRLPKPPPERPEPPRERLPDPPPDLFLDVYGTERYTRDAVLGRRRLITLRASDGPSRGGAASETGDGDVGPGADAGGDDLGSLVEHFAPQAIADEEPEPTLAEPVRRSMLSRSQPLFRARALGSSLLELITEQTVGHVFLKQVRDAADGDRAILQQVVEARSRVTPGSLRWQRVRRSYEIDIEQLESQPLEQELGLQRHQLCRHAFVAEFGFRMQPGVVVWPPPSPTRM